MDGKKATLEAESSKITLPIFQVNPAQESELDKSQGDGTKYMVSRDF